MLLDSGAIRIGNTRLAHHGIQIVQATEGIEVALADLAGVGHDDGTLGADETLEHRSIVDTVFEARWLPGEARADGTATVIPEVSGTAHRTGEHRFTLDPLDSVGTGFTLR